MNKFDPKNYNHEFQWRNVERKDNEKDGFFYDTFPAKKYRFPYSTMWGRLFVKDKEGFGHYEVDRDGEKKTIFRKAWYFLMRVCCFLLKR